MCIRDRYNREWVGGDSKGRSEMMQWVQRDVATSELMYYANSIIFYRHTKGINSLGKTWKVYFPSSFYREKE